MIVVTGAPRTGTSLVMQTLALLGVPMAAPKFIPLHEPIRHFNPNGFYELEFYGGIKTNEYKDKAIKLFGYQYATTDKSLISKTIITTRNKDEAVNSYNKLSSLLPEEYHVNASDLYDANVFYINSVKDDYLELDLNEIKDDKYSAIEKIISYLGIKPNDVKINKSLNNIQCQ